MESSEFNNMKQSRPFSFAQSNKQAQETLSNNYIVISYLMSVSNHTLGRLVHEKNGWHQIYFIRFSKANASSSICHLHFKCKCSLLQVLALSSIVEKKVLRWWSFEHEVVNRTFWMRNNNTRYDYSKRRVQDCILLLLPEDWVELVFGSSATAHRRLILFRLVYIHLETMRFG